jgi:hypothetical protein
MLVLLSLVTVAEPTCCVPKQNDLLVCTRTMDSNNHSWQCQCQWVSWMNFHYPLWFAQSTPGLLSCASYHDCRFAHHGASNFLEFCRVQSRVLEESHDRHARDAQQVQKSGVHDCRMKLAFILYSLLTVEYSEYVKRHSHTYFVFFHTHASVQQP